MMVLRLGNKELYCEIKLHEVEKVVLSNLGFLASSLVSFLMSENSFADGCHNIKQFKKSIV